MCYLKNYSKKDLIANATLYNILQLWLQANKNLYYGIQHLIMAPWNQQPTEMLW